jgi:hypothetical protein
MAYDAARAAHAARAATEAQAAEDAGATAEAAPGRTFETLIREFVDETTFPRLYRIAWSAAADGAAAPPDERAEFLFGLDRILDGVQALIDRNSADT